LIIKLLIIQLLPPFPYFYFLSFFLLGSNIVLRPRPQTLSNNILPLK
jgi:hypothetical protein